MHIKIDKSRCIGSGQCILAAEDLFDIDDDEGVVAVLRQPASEEEVARARAAAAACPTGTIIIEE